MEPKLLDRVCSTGQHDLEYKAIWIIGTHKVRIRRRRNTYEFQSSASISRWNGTSWLELDTMHYSQMTQSADDCYVVRDGQRPNAAELADEKELLRMALLILGNEG